MISHTYIIYMARHTLLIHHTELSPATTEAILDYLREVVEEGLNLDVTGDALLERFSMQCVSDAVLPGVMDLAVSLGITRFVTTGIDSSGNSSGIVNRSVTLNSVDKPVIVLDTMSLNKVRNTYFMTYT